MTIEAKKQRFLGRNRKNELTSFESLVKMLPKYQVSDRYLEKWIFCNLRKNKICFGDFRAQFLPIYARRAGTGKVENLKFRIFSSFYG